MANTDGYIPANLLDGCTLWKHRPNREKRYLSLRAIIQKSQLFEYLVWPILWQIQKIATGNKPSRETREVVRPNRKRGKRRSGFNPRSDIFGNPQGVTPYGKLRTQLALVCDRGSRRCSCPGVIADSWMGRSKGSLGITMHHVPIGSFAAASLATVY